MRSLSLERLQLLVLVTLSTPINFSLAFAQEQVAFDYAGVEQTWAVPPGVTAIDVDARGAQGGPAPSRGLLGDESKLFCRSRRARFSACMWEVRAGQAWTRAGRVASTAGGTVVRAMTPAAIRGEEVGARQTSASAAVRSRIVCWSRRVAEVRAAQPAEPAGAPVDRVETIRRTGVAAVVGDRRARAARAAPR